MTTIERLAKRGNRAAVSVMDAWNPDQPRDEKGMWSGDGSGGGPGSSAASESEHAAAMAYHKTESDKHTARGERDAAMYHTMAYGAHAQAKLEHARISSIQKDADTLRAIGKKDPASGGEKTAGLRDRQAEVQKTFADRASKQAREMSMKASTASSKAGGGSSPSGRGGMDPRTTSSAEQDAREARELASGDRVPLARQTVHESTRQWMEKSRSEMGKGDTRREDALHESTRAWMAKSRQEMVKGDTRREDAARAEAAWATQRQTQTSSSRGRDPQGRNLNNKYERNASMIASGKWTGRTKRK